MSEWQALAAGFAFYLILEGVLPFFNPSGFKRFLEAAQDVPEGQMRLFGGVMLALGLVLLFSVK